MLAKIALRAKFNNKTTTNSSGLAKQQEHKHALL